MGIFPTLGEIAHLHLQSTCFFLVPYICQQDLETEHEWRKRREEREKRIKEPKQKLASKKNLDDTQAVREFYNQKDRRTNRVVDSEKRIFCEQRAINPRREE